MIPVKRNAFLEAIKRVGGVNLQTLAAAFVRTFDKSSPIVLTDHSITPLGNDLLSSFESFRDLILDHGDTRNYAIRPSYLFSGAVLAEFHILRNRQNKMSLTVRRTIVTHDEFTVGAQGTRIIVPENDHPRTREWENFLADRMVVTRSYMAAPAALPLKEDWLAVPFAGQNIDQHTLFREQSKLLSSMLSAYEQNADAIKNDDLEAQLHKQSAAQNILSVDAHHICTEIRNSAVYREIYNDLAHALHDAGIRPTHIGPTPTYNTADADKLSDVKGITEEERLILYLGWSAKWATEFEG